LEKQQISQLARQINKASTMKVLTLNAFTVGMAVLAATGCASKVWYQPGNTLSQERRDEARCKLEAERNGSPLAMAGLAFAIADKGHKDEIFKQGMLSLGYEQVDKRTVSKEYFEVSSVSRKANGTDLKLEHDLIGHWTSEQLTGNDAKAKQVELTFRPNNQLIFKTQWLKEQAVNTDSFEGSYFVRDAKLMVRSPGEKAQPWD
jgi:hypothetical protein